MKKNNIFRFCSFALASALALTACNDVLDEQPRSSYDPTFFQTEEGVEGGLTSLYAHLRNIYGQAYYYNACETGTDEYTWAHSADANFKDADMSGVGSLTPTSCRADVIWGQSFTDINTASAVIENASKVGIEEALVAEAYFFRAFHYFNLVQTFGGVPLDLGGGELHSNDAPKRTSVRNTVDEVYTRCIFPDLEKAVSDLSETPRVTGGLTKNVARLFLSKAYLTYAWWLQNPNGIDTYPATSGRDASQAPAYFQKAYDVALEGISNPGVYSLQNSFRDVNLAQNDRNSECMLWADHTEEDEYYNGGSLSWGNGGAPDNFVSWFTQWNYCGDMTATGSSGSVFVPVQREACQPLGRPWTRMAPCPDAFSKFTDKDKDSRFANTFTIQYDVNMAKGGKTDEYVLGANGAHIANGETFLEFVEDGSGITYSPDNGNINAGVKAGYDCFVIALSQSSRRSYPGVWKTGPYRTDNGDGLGSPNGGSTRPFVIAKFSEFYLIAAEAAVKGASGAQSARDLVNVLRLRAGRWTSPADDDASSRPIVSDFGADLVAATPATIDVDYILDERMREFWGEGYRWFDLVRTQTWAERAASYHISDGFGRDPQLVTRDIKPYHYLRPIPQGQLDGMEASDEEKAAYQNPNY